MGLERGEHPFFFPSSNGIVTKTTGPFWSDYTLTFILHMWIATSVYMPGLGPVESDPNTPQRGEKLTRFYRMCPIG